MNNNKELGTVLATSSESATSATTISNKRAFITKYWTLAVIAILMSAVIALSSVLIVVLKNKDVDNVQSDDPTSITQDFEELAEKYQDRFIFNDNGTVRLNVFERSISDNPIAAVDMQRMQEYSTMLEQINRLVENGTMYIDNDGNYQMVKQSERDWTGKSGRFYVKTKKILWIIPIPVGYYLVLASNDAVWLGLIAMGFKFASMLFAGIGLNPNVSMLQKFKDSIVRAIGISAGNALFGILDIGGVFNTLYAIVIAGSAIENVLSLATAGVGKIIAVVVKVVIAIFASYFYDRVGGPFLMKGLLNITNSNNAVEMNSDLIFASRTINSIRN